MLPEMFWNSLIVTVIMATTVYGNDRCSADFQILKTQVAELTNVIQKLNDKNYRNAEMTTGRDQTQSGTKSTLEVFKKEVSDKLKMLKEKVDELDKSAYLAELQIVKMSTDYEQLRYEINITIDEAKREIKSPLELFMNDTSGKLQRLNDQTTALNKSTSQIEKQIIKLRNDLNDMKNNRNSTFLLCNNTNEIKKPKAETTEPCTSSAQAGSVYIRWGAASCSQGADLLYVGYVAGNSAKLSGSAVNSLCLPKEPDLNFSRYGEDHADVYGAVYSMKEHKSYLLKPTCAVCRIKRSTIIMIPAKLHCQSGWFTEYSGYLLASKSDEASTEYNCFDVQMSDYGSEMKTSEKPLYFTVVMCGALPCGTYKQNAVLTCVVCSR